MKGKLLELYVKGRVRLIRAVENFFEERPIWWRLSWSS